jgi:hypothetical protein
MFAARWMKEAWLYVESQSGRMRPPLRGWPPPDMK